MENSFLTLPLPENERAVGDYIDSLTSSSPEEALAFVKEFLKSHCEDFTVRGKSASTARCVTRFLLHKKSKDFLIPVILDNPDLRKIVFGELNTYKYSIVFILKRLVKTGNTDIIKEVLDLLSENPYRDDSAKDYSDRWSLSFIVRETLSAPDDYLNLSKENKKLIEEYLK